jgi:hypothetical protein
MPWLGGRTDECEIPPDAEQRKADPNARAKCRDPDRRGHYDERETAGDALRPKREMSAPVTKLGAYMPSTRHCRPSVASVTE